MSQGSTFENIGSTDSTTRGSTGGDAVADRFNQEFSTSDIKHFYDGRRSSTDSSQESNNHVAAMLGGFAVDGDRSTSATIWSDNKKDSVIFASGRSESSTFDPTLHPLDEGNGKADVYFGKGKSSFSYDQIQMRSIGVL